MFCKYVLLLSSVSISPTMRLEGTRYSETRANLYSLTHRQGLQFHPSKPHISSTSLLRKRGGNETVNLLEAAKSLSLSLYLSLCLGFLSPCAKRESFNRRHKFQRGSCGTAIYQRLHHETVAEYSVQHSKPTILEISLRYCTKKLHFCCIEQYITA